MATPILMLVLMTAPYLLARALRAGLGRGPDPRAAAAAGLGVLFVFTGVGHFTLTEPMMQMLPPWVPGKLALVYATGVLEFAIALGFFVPQWRRTAGWTAAAVLVLFFPANVYAALNHVPMGGHAWGPVYLLIRAPVQLAVLAWIYWFTLREPRATTHARPVLRASGGSR